MLTGGPYTITVGAYYWMIFLMNWTGTSSQFGRNQNLHGSMANWGMNSAGIMRAATNAGSVTAIPSPLVPASNVATGLELWGSVLSA